ncbi:hypothetical protein DN752_06680 [Echinicola strongylocentroti]|uniref:Uncharacterized protein n=1 Tax=Echinicola strongylocentroti TaxID=1795355 RepID=A0A2Z4IGJ3_9BACT|nr:hypothetical protein [Echinicola strongylocentroti]AWW29829.1 hypothetical protein DN752_06680 [Echinicola strongylocentroti]
MIHEELQQLQQLANKVTKKIEQIELEKQSLEEQLGALQRELQEKETSLDHFKNQIKISKIVNNIPVENIASAELRNRIDNYIKEIDKIITYLSE